VVNSEATAACEFLALSHELDLAKDVPLPAREEQPVFIPARLAPALAGSRAAAAAPAAFAAPDRDRTTDLGQFSRPAARLRPHLQDPSRRALHSSPSRDALTPRHAALRNQESPVTEVA